MCRQRAGAVLLAFSAIALGVAPAAAQQGGAAQRGLSTRDVAALDAYAAQAMRDWRIPGMALAVVTGDSVLLAKGYGVRARGRDGAVDAGTRFAIGSTTKAMTVLALAMLVDEGRVAWDAPVIRYLPHFRVADPYVTRELTVRDLLTHRGGLGNADQLWSAVDYSTEEIVRRTATLEPAYSLRSGFIYQNIMYAVAGEVVAAASGMLWSDFLQTRIFDPLGMQDTEARLSDLAGQENIAAPHMILGDSARVVANRPVDAVAAAGSVWSSIRDMAAWTRFMLDSARIDGERLVSAQSYAQIMSPQVIAPPMYPATTLSRPRFFTYGLGWFIHDYAGAGVVMHTGSIDGMSALIGLLPDRQLGIYVLANLDHAELRHALMYRAFDLAAGRTPRDWSAELMELYGGIAARADSARAVQERTRPRDTRPGLPLERYAGTYEHPTYGRAAVTQREGALHFAFGHGRIGPLEHWAYDTFRARWQDERMSPSLVTFTTDGAGGVTSVRAFGVTFTKMRSP